MSELIVKKSNAFATVAMVVGIVAAVFGWTGPFGLVLAIVALVFGILGLVKKQSKGKSITGIVLGAIALVTALIVISIASAVVAVVTDDGNASLSGDSSASEVDKQTTFKVGDAIDFDDKKVTVTAVERNWNSGNEYITPGTGKEYVKVQVSIENNSKTEASYNTFDWKIQDTQGVIQDIDSNTYVVDGGLNSGELASGGKVTGFMIFAVPADDAGLVLSYSPSFFTNKKVEIKL